ncbi:MAG: GNAT family N-acetyltransferase, partial [Dehalococcoidia bacterium]|nr:GNAT family N-acetyltransferase [Dehalococcoidia bacterium]
VIMGRLVNLFPHGTTGAWIEVLGIDPGWQGHGIGVKLMKAFETHCRKKGAHHINMLTLPHDDILKPFFESQGFTASRFIQLEKNIA